VLRVSAARKVVRADVELDDRRLATRGTTVSVSLPDGTSAKAVVAAVGSAIEKELSGGEGAVVIPTTIRFRHQRKAKGFGHAAVTIHFADVQRRDALTVPVEALIALGANRFGVEVPAPNGAIRRVPVRTGLFAGGRVVVSGHGIHRGLKIVVP
jgi:multidrug efflux pump subunit AcrA (membrane-fusion protein)